MAYSNNKVISVNWDWAKKVGKAKFLKALEHLQAEKQLSEMFDEKFGKPKSEDKK